MNIKIFPKQLSGSVAAIPSKSQAHRLLICAVFSDAETELICPEVNRDIEATAACLTQLGAQITRTKWGYRVVPAKQIPSSATLDCGESGSTLRFLLPVVGALGVDGSFLLFGRLSRRPLSPLQEEMERMGCSITRPTENTLRCTGRLTAGDYSIDASVSSQFVSGLLFALSLIDGKSTLRVTGKIESAPYIEMTRQALKAFGCDPTKPGLHSFRSPGRVCVEGDWSNGAFFLTAAMLGNPICVTGLDPESTQGDRAASELLTALKNGPQTIDASHIPDLVPILSVAATRHGALFTNISRLRLKESDRVASVCEMLNNLGIQTAATDNSLQIFPGTIRGGVVDSYNDHRIAMSAAIAATIADSPVTILGAESVSKSYPGFWADYARLGGNYEQHLR